MSCCLCYPTVCTHTPPTPKCPDGNCLRIPHLLVGADNSVGPCGETGLIPFADTGINTSLCGLNPPTYTILSASNIFTNVSINSTGITFTTAATESNDSFGVIEYAVSCGKYASTATATIILKNLCASVICPTNQTCDRCTGNCVDIDGDIGVGGSALNGTNVLTVI